MFANGTDSIERVLLNKLGDFARCLDQRNWQKLDEVFSQTISFDYADGRGEQRGMEALKRQFQTFLDACGPSQHLLGSIQIDEGPTAGVLITRCYVQARHQGKGEKEALFFDSNGEYVDQWIKEPQGWRIIDRRVTWAMLQGDIAVLQH